MKKTLISLLLSLSVVAAPLACFADASTTPTVILNDRTVYFNDQKPVITEEGRTLVPARGIFEAMGAEVLWDDATKTATFNSQNGITRVLVTNDNPVMTVYTFVSLMKAEKEEIKLDVAPTIIGDRTMVPLRAISESLKADVNWDEATKIITIDTIKDTPQNPGTETPKDTRINLSISADKEKVAVGEEVTISLNAKNVEQLESKMSGITATIFYDKTKFEYVSSAFVVNGTVKENALGVANENYLEDSVKSIYIVADSTQENAKDGVAMTLTFKALTDSTADFVLSDRTTTSRGSDTNILFEINNKTTTFESSDKLFIDTTPVTVNK